jgi:hypothetical protein
MRKLIGIFLVVGIVSVWLRILGWQATSPHFHLSLLAQIVIGLNLPAHVVSRFLADFVAPSGEAHVFVDNIFFLVAVVLQWAWFVDWWRQPRGHAHAAAIYQWLSILAPAFLGIVLSISLFPDFRRGPAGLPSMTLQWGFWHAVVGSQTVFGGCG